MEGDKISVITGDDFSITCTTDLDADEIQWILDRETVLSSSNSMELHLSLPLDDGEASVGASWSLPLLWPS